MAGFSVTKRGLDTDGNGGAQVGQLPAKVVNAVSGASAYVVPSGGDDTTQIAAALAGFAPYASPRIVFGLGTFSFTSLTVTTTAEFIGSGEGTILKQAAGTNAHGIACTTNGVSLTFRDLTLDANQANQTNDASHAYDTIHISADASSATAPERLTCRGVTFKNGRFHDIYVQKGTGESSTSQFLLDVSACTFLGGVEATNDGTFGPEYILAIQGVSAKVENNLFDFQGTPTVGRGGVAMDSSTLFGRLEVVGNEFRNVGMSPSAGNVIGCIDGYSGAVDSVITDNQLVNPFGRGINVKSDENTITISNNVIDGLTGTVQDAQIVLNQLVHGTVNGNIAITGNTLAGSGRDGISLTGVGTGGNAANFELSGNVIVGYTRRGIGLVQCGDVNITGNTITSTVTNADTIYADNCVGTITIAGNTLDGSPANGIEIANTNVSASFNLTGNTIKSPTKYGIFIAAGLGGIISGNTIEGAGFPAIHVAGTTQLVHVTGNRARGTNSVFEDGGTNTKLWVASDNYFENGLISGKPDSSDSRLWVPQGLQDWQLGVRETMPRYGAGVNTVALVSGTLQLVGIELFKGDVITNIVFVPGTTAAVTPTNQWFALFDASRNKLAVTADDTTTAWPAITVSASNKKSLAVAGGPYTVTATGKYYLGIVVVAATPPTLTGMTGTGGLLVGEAPAFAGRSSTGLTDPTSCPSTAAALTGNAGVPYAFVS